MRMAVAGTLMSRKGYHKFRSQAWEARDLATMRARNAGKPVRASKTDLGFWARNDLDVVHSVAEFQPMGVRLGGFTHGGEDDKEGGVYREVGLYFRTQKPKDMPVVAEVPKGWAP